MFRRIRYNKYAEPSLSGMTLRPSIESIIMRYTSVGLTSFLVALLAFSIFAPVESTDATTVLSALSAGDSTVSISTSASTVDLSLSASVSGSVRTALDTVSVTAGGNGYQLYLSASGNTNALIRDGATSTGTDATTGAPTYADSDIIPTLTNSNNLVPITSPTNLENNTWGFAVPARNTTAGSGSEDVVSTATFDASYPVGNNSSASSKFASVPTKGNDILIAKRSSSADAVPTNFYYGVKANSSKPSGLYQNTITYTAIGDSNTNGLASISPERTNQLAGGVTLNIATSSTLALASIDSISITVGGSACTNPTSAKSDGGTGSLVNLTCTSPALATGWHEVIANINTTASNTETYVVNPGIEYYSDEETVASTMQDFDILQCNAMNTGQTAILRDSRDGKTYSIAKMADGNCWMNQNLRLGTPGQSITLTSADSDVTTDYTISSSDIQTSGGISWYDDTNATTIKSSTNTTHIYSFIENSNVSANDKIAYGNLYNWYTATASTGTYDTTDGNASSSICPKGWQLPLNYGNQTINTSYPKLVYSSIENMASMSSPNTTVTNALQKSPLSFVFAGAYKNNEVTEQGFSNRYWSRTSIDGGHITQNFGFYNTGNFRFPYNDYRHYGFSVRCVFVPTMQNFSAVTCANLDTGKSVTLIDSRDLNTYSVTKQADGNCWMTQNLRLGTTSDGTSTRSVTLTVADSDLPAGSADYAISTSDIQTSDGTDWSTNTDATHVYSFANTTNATTYGNLYNWYTATAKTGTSSIDSGDASGSICPKNWKLPTDTNNGSYVNLIQTQIPGAPTNASNGAENKTNYTDKFQQTPLSFVLSGSYASTGLYAQGIYGNYWSRIAVSTNNARRFDFGINGYFGLLYSHDKYLGFAVRCVFTPTMQDFSTTACSNLKTAQSLTLTDNRDMNDYQVTKQADGNCWMTQNLRLGTTRDGTGVQNVTLTSANSDITGADKTLVDNVSAIQTSGDDDWSTNIDAYHIYSFANTDDVANYGNLYNWYTATASSGTASITDGTDASMSICPKNWHLPPDNNVGSYANLIQSHFPGIPDGGGTDTSYTDAFQQAPLNFSTAGYRSRWISTKDRAAYWSRTSTATSTAKSMGYRTDGAFWFHSNDYRYFGFAVRCVLVL